MAGTIVVDRIESDASYASTINVASQITFSNTVNFGANPIFTNAFDKIFSITASVATNALTVTLNPCALDFRSSTLTSGTIVTRTVTSAISVTVSSGSTLGTVSAQQSRIVVLAIDNAGTVELAVVNISGGNQLDETNLITTTAEGGAGAADSASTIYSTTARTSVAYKVVGYVESTQTTAGTWATAPSTIQGKGGQALAAMSSIGYGQTWQNLTGSRSLSTTYYNTTGKPLGWNITADGGSPSISMTINGTERAFTYIAASSNPFASLIIQPGASYSAAISGGTLRNWQELR